MADPFAPSDDRADAIELAGRLLRASGRIERSLYGRPIAAADATFLLDWSEALISLAEGIIFDRGRNDDAEGGEGRAGT